LGFPGPNDVARFKGTKPGDGPSDHLRTAIEGELAVKVKYLPAPLPSAAPERNLAESGKAPRPSDQTSSEPEERGPGAKAPAGSSSSTARAPQRPAPTAAAPVTEWAVAAIPQGEPESAPPADAAASAPAATEPAASVAAEPAAAPRVAQFPVDEEPADVEAMPASGWYEPGHDGDVLDDEPPFPDDADDPGPDADPDPYGAPEPALAPVGQAVSELGGADPAPASAARPDPAPAAAPASARPDPAPRAAPPAPAVVERAPRSGAPGVQRYGEAVVRQVLGARFLREEPYEPQTRFQ
ncbi:MAG: hypothetical protein B7X32_19335, partial [Microbacterium sp. 13-71-7]